MRNSTFLLTTISAAATGVALGVLFAPRKGEATREQLSKKSQEYADYAADRFDELVDAVSKTINEAEEQTASLASKAKTKASKTAENIEEDATDLADEAKSRARETADEARSNLNK